jgi:hypothetical protein
MDNEIRLERVSKRTFRIRTGRLVVRESVERFGVGWTPAREPQTPRLAGMSRFATGAQRRDWIRRPTGRRPTGS